VVDLRFSKDNNSDIKCVVHVLMLQYLWTASVVCNIVDVLSLKTFTPLLRDKCSIS